MSLYLKHKKLVSGEMQTIKDGERKDKNLLSQTAILLRENLHLILQNQELILSTPEYYFAELPLASIYIGIGPYSEDFIKLPLGVLLQLWDEGTLIMPCEKCSIGKVHIFHWFGNTLRPQGTSEHGAGHYVYRGVCNKCSEDIQVFQKGVLAGSQSPDPMNEFWSCAKKARQVFNENQEVASVLKPGLSQRFSWSRGLIEEATSIKEIIKPVTEPLAVNHLVEILHMI